MKTRWKFLRLEGKTIVSNHGDYDHKAVWTPERRKVASDRNKLLGVVPPNRKGTVMPESAKLAISAYNKLVHKEPPHYSGELHPLWKGGKVTEKVRKARYQSHRRALKNASLGNHTYEQWLELKEKFGNKCLACLKIEPEIKLAADHVIPISLKGSDSIENIQPLCQPCNSSKRTKVIDYRRISNEIYV